METVVQGIGCFSNRSPVFAVSSVKSSSSLFGAAASVSCNGGAVTESTQESVGDNVVLSRDVSYVDHELWYEVQVTELPW
jgi:hypothetical protein